MGKKKKATEKSNQTKVNGVECRSPLCRDICDKTLKIIETSNAIIVGLDKNHMIRLFNNGAEKITGYKEKEVMGMDWFKLFIKPEIYDEMDQVWKDAWGVDFHSYMNPIWTKKGEKRMISWQTTGLYEDDDERNHLLISIGEDITERKKAEKELRESAVYLDIMGDALIVLDSEARVIKVNNSFSEMWGYDPDEVYGKPVFMLFTKGESPKHKREMKKSKEKGKLRIFETIALTKDKKEIDVSVSGTAYKDDEGKLLNFIALFRDITGQKKAEEAVIESEAKFRSIFNEAMDGIVLINANTGEIADCNAEFVKMTCRSLDELRTMKIWDIRPDDLKDEAKKVFNLVGSKGFGEYVDLDFVKPDGSLTPIEFKTRVVKIRDHDYILSMVRDTSERRRFEEALIESEERFRSVFNNTAIGLYRTTPEGDILMANPALVKMLGYSSFEETMQRDLNKEGYVEPYSRNQFINRIEKEGEIKGLETRWTRNDGSHVDIREHARKITDEEGKTLYYEGTVEDITERKRAEKALSESREQLQTIFNASIDGIAVDNKDDILIYVNHSMLTLFGYDEPEELISYSLRNLVHPDDEKKVTQYSKKRKEGKGVVDRYDFKARRRDSTIFDCEVSTSTYESKGETFSVGIFRDVSERKKIEREMRRRLMRFDMEEGNLYLLKEGTLAESMGIFEDLLKVGYRGLIFSRTPKSQFNYEIDEAYIHAWISEKPINMSVRPNDKALLSIVNDQSPKMVIILDSLDYLVSKLGQKKVLSLIQGLNEIAFVKSHIMIIPFDPGIFSKNNRNLIEKEGRDIEPLVKEAVPEDLLEVLRYVYEMNLVGIKPTYSKVGSELNLSKPTVRKRVYNLTSKGYLIEKPKGRVKPLEITEKGRMIFLK